VRENGRISMVISQMRMVSNQVKRPIRLDGMIPARVDQAKSSKNAVVNID